MTPMPVDLPLTAQLVNGPSNGQLTLNSDGSFSYTPNAGFWGADSFTYTAGNGMATSKTATVTMTVNSHPGRPNMILFATVEGQELDATLQGDNFRRGWVRPVYGADDRSGPRPVVARFRW